MATILSVSHPQPLSPAADDQRLSGWRLTRFSAIAVPVAAAGLPLGVWLGFDPKATNSPEALHGLALVFALGPALAHALSALLIAGFPLDESRHAEIRRELGAREATLVPAE